MDIGNGSVKMPAHITLACDFHITQNVCSQIAFYVLAVLR